MNGISEGKMFDSTVNSWAGPGSKATIGHTKSTCNSTSYMMLPNKEVNYLMLCQESGEKQHEFYFLLQVFPGSLLPHNYADPQNPDHLLARSEVERRREYIQPLHGQLGEKHPLVKLVHWCLHNTPARRPSAEELLQQLEVVRAQIEGAYGQIVKVDMEKVRALREKDTEIRRLQQQMQQLEVGIVCGDTRYGYP